MSEDYPEIPEGVIYRPGHDELWWWFGGSYASFLTLPRVLMHEMPDKWQWQMAKLLKEYDDFYPNQPDIGTQVQATRGKKLIKWPAWLLNYRHPAYEEIEKLKGQQTEDERGGK